MKTFILFFGIVGILYSCDTQGQSNIVEQNTNNTMQNMEKSDDEWKNELTPDEYRILRQCGTEPPGSGKYYHFDEDGQYKCAACGHHLFDSKTKYSSGSGWPSFYDVQTDSSVVTIEDNKYGMQRIEVRCANCGGHLGHVFPDGPKPTGLRYCINSVSLNFEERENNKTSEEK